MLLFKPNSIGLTRFASSTSGTPLEDALEKAQVDFTRINVSHPVARPLR